LHGAAFDSLLLGETGRFLCLEHLLVLHAEREIRLMIFTLVRYLHESLPLLLIQVLLLDHILARASRRVDSAVGGHFYTTLCYDEVGCLLW
jgi:hypothetical protein